MVPKRTNTQVQGIVFCKRLNSFLFLVLKGGYWQPITGGVTENENPIAAIKREVDEELGINKFKVIDISYKFIFSLENGKQITEHVFGIEVNGKEKLYLSYEHVECKWLPYSESRKILQWESNKIALDKLREFLNQSYGKRAN